VLERYIAMATEAGVPQAVFPEGGLSRDGRIREPRLGVLDYMLRGFHRDGERDLVFVPLGINYDRVLEDRTLLSTQKESRVRTAWSTLRFLLHNLKLAMRSEWHRFGYACVNFGSPVSMRSYGVDFQRLAGEERKRAVARLGRELMDAVGRVVPVVPVALIAHVFLEHRSLTELDLKAETRRLLQRLETAHVYIPRRDLDYALTVGLRMLRLRRLVEEREGVFSARQEELPLLRYYANSIAHLLQGPDAKIEPEGAG
jgi:glycerol-3-phosphate O-acyltransferase